MPSEPRWPSELRWIVSSRASCLHAAGALACGARLVDERTAAALTDASRLLARLVDELGLNPHEFFEHAIPLATQIDVPVLWAEALWSKLLGPGRPDRQHLDRLTQALFALQAAFDIAHPAALDELELRSAPLREQWEARGAGLLAGIGRLIAPELLVDSAGVVLVHPVLGGGGHAHPRYNLVRFEAVLANPVASLPEVLRLGWLIAQLNFDLPIVADYLAGERGRMVASRALIPAVLAAGQDVELTAANDATLATALQTWTGGAQDTEPLSQWWQTYLDSSPPWPVALRALEQMLPPRE